MTKELLQQALDEAKADAIYVFTYAEGISAASKDAIEYMHSWLTVYFDKQALAQQEQCGCREGECETKKDKACRMTIEIAERDGIPEWTPTIGIDCAISSLRDDAARLRDGSYTPLQIADDLDVIANDLGKCNPVAQQEQPAQEPLTVVPRTMILEDADLRFLHGLSQPDDEDGSFSPITLTVGDGHAGHGIYASLSEYPEEGADIIYKFAAPTQPAQEPCGYLDEFGNFENMLLAWTRMKEEPGVAWAPVYKRPAPTQPALSDLNELAKVHSQQYVSPHHMVFNVEGLLHLIEAHCRGGANK